MILANRVLRAHVGLRGQRERERGSERGRKKVRERGRNVLNEDIHQVSLR